MRVLIVCSYRDYIADGIAPFIKEQVEAITQNLRNTPVTSERIRELENEGVEAEYYLIRGKGILGYIREIPRLRKKIGEFKPDVIHAHFGLSGLLANLAIRKVPVVVTYHGSDINNPSVYRYSKCAIRLSAWNIFVSQKNMDKAGAQNSKKASLIPCGIDDTLFVPMGKEECRERLKNEGVRELESERKKYVLFTKMFDDPVKDYPLAKAVIELTNERVKELKNERVELLEFTGYTREQTVLLMNAVDAILMTSKTEGSPQVIKEAMACGTPIVSVDVGDVKERICGIDGCYVAETRNPEELADLLEKSLSFNGKTNGREVLMKQNLSNTLVAQKLLEIYAKVANT